MMLDLEIYLIKALSSNPIYIFACHCQAQAPALDLMLRQSLIPVVSIASSAVLAPRLAAVKPATIKKERPVAS